MRKSLKATIFASAILLGAGNIELGAQQTDHGLFSFTSEAQARVGRPRTPRSAAGVVRRATPGTAAGVVRRTTHRTIRRGAYVARLPTGCHYGTYYGHHAYNCNGAYYQKSGSRYVVIHFD
jgi:hypothetical protein